MNSSRPSKQTSTARDGSAEVVSVAALCPEATKLMGYLFDAGKRLADGEYRFAVTGPVRPGVFAGQDGQPLVHLSKNGFRRLDPGEAADDAARLTCYVAALGRLAAFLRGCGDHASLEPDLLQLGIPGEQAEGMVRVVGQLIEHQGASSTQKPTARGEPAEADSTPAPQPPAIAQGTQPAAREQAAAVAPTPPEQQGSLSPATEVSQPHIEVSHATSRQHYGREEASDTVHVRSVSQAATIAFPETGYVGVAAKFAQLFAEEYESPKEFLYLDGLTLIGAVVSGRVRADFDLPVQPRLYVVKVARSAWRRKSTSTRLADQFMQTVLRRIGENKLQPRDWPQVIYGAGSAEGVGVELMPKEHEESGLEWSQTTRRAVLVFDELRRFEAKAVIKGSALRPMVNELFEANCYHNLTLSCPIRIEDGHLAFLSNATEETYRNLLEAVEFRDIGFLNRLFIVTSNSNKRVARPKAPAESLLWPIREELAQYISELPPLNEDGSASEEVVVPLTPEADATWTEWYAALPETEQTARLDNLGMRLMGLLAFSSGRKRIDLELLRSVLDILQYQQRVRATYRPIEAENPAAKVEQRIVLALHQHGPLSRRQLHRRIHAERCGVQLFDTALTNLIREKRAKLIQGVIRPADEEAEEEP